ncbi:MAG: hypothetical protein ACOC22_02635 [bacterium]
MKKTRIEVICDVCKRNHKDVNTVSRHGHGRLVFTHTGGGNGGGASNEKIWEDICIDCCEKLVNLLKKFKEERS